MKVSEFEDRVKELLERIKKKMGNGEDTKLEQKSLYVNLQVLKSLNPMSQVLINFKRENPNYLI